MMIMILTIMIIIIMIIIIIIIIIMITAVYGRCRSLQPALASPLSAEVWRS